MCGKTTTTTGQSTSGTSQAQSWNTAAAATGPEQGVIDEGVRNYTRAMGTITGQIKNPQAYGGERVAGLGADFNMGAELTRGMADSPDLRTARTMLDRVRSPAAIQEEMNPFTSAVLDPTLRKIREQMSRDLMGIDAQASMAGAFGDTGHGMERALTRERGMQAVGDAAGALNYQGFNDTVARLMGLSQGYAGLGGQDFAQTTQLGQLLAGFDERRRGVEQDRLNVGYSDFVEARDRPIQLEMALMDLLNAMPQNKVVMSSDQGSQSGTSSSSGTGSSSVPNTGGWSMAGQLAGTLLGNWL